MGDNHNKLFETNNYSVISKYSCIKSGYFKDDILERFVEDSLSVKTWKRTPLVNLGYAARMLAMDWIVNRSIKLENIDCFIVLGAGYDFTPFRHQYKHISWIEVDLPEVVSTKSQFIGKLLGHQEVSFNLINEFIYSYLSSNYHLIECDIRDSARLASFLKLIFSSTTYKPKRIAILNEACLCYLDSSDIVRIFQDVINSVEEFALRVYYIGFEHMKPNEMSPFNDVMTNHFRSLGHPLKHFPSPSETRKLFIEDLNFNHSTVIPMYQIFHNILVDLKIREPFDEFEEMHLYLSHYAIVTGTVVLKDPFIQGPDTKYDCQGAGDLGERIAEINLNSSNSKIKFIPSDIERYGHSSCILEEKLDRYTMIVSGGFGKNQSHHHRRLDDCLLQSKQSDSFELETINTEDIKSSNIKLDRMYGQIGKLSNGSLFFNGGRQSPSIQHPPNLPFIVCLTDDLKIKLSHLFNLTESNTMIRWRHKICSVGSDRFIQVGGLSDSAHPSSPVIMWNVSSSDLGFESIYCNSYHLYQRHSFGMDVRGNSCVIIGGLRVERNNREFVHHPISEDINTVILDIREGKSHSMTYDLANCYGSSVHFINDYQLIKIGGISTKTGLAEDKVQLLDLRSSVQSTVDILPSADNQMILTNATVCHSEVAREIITIGGGGNYFTFGTRFNRSNLVYKYQA